MTRDDDELTNLRRAFAAPGPPGETAGLATDCPEPDLIWEAVRGELRADKVREIVNHVAVCSSCAEDWRIAVAFEEEARAAEAPARVIRPSIWRFRPWMTAAAAALVLTVAGIQLRPEKPVYRGDGGTVVIPETASASRESFVLRWKPVAGAESYEMLMMNTSDLVIVANPKDLTATEYQVPASALAGIPDGARLSWMVTAVFPDGSRQQSTAIITTLE